VQVATIKPTLKAPGTKHLKLKTEKLLSNFGFKLHLRRYTLATFGDVALTTVGTESVLWKMSAEGTTLWAVGGGGGGTSVVADGANAVVAAGQGLTLVTRPLFRST